MQRKERQDGRYGVRDAGSLSRGENTEFVSEQCRGKNIRLAGVQAAGDSVFMLSKGVLNPRTKIEGVLNPRMHYFGEIWDGGY